MAVITSITQQRRGNRRSVFIDGDFAFGCNVNVVARFRLREGMAIDDTLRREIELGEVKQEAFDHALRLVGQRRQSERELRTKLGRKEYGPAVIDAVFDDLQRLGYLDDVKYAEVRAGDSVRLKKHGPQRARSELIAKGIDADTAEQAVAAVYENVDELAMATELAKKKTPSLRRLEPEVARRRLIGFLQRRGFDFDTVRRAVESTLGSE
ncbi:MAG: RecX family transcriptional regulator [Planctomycetota bacterium]